MLALLIAACKSTHKPAPEPEQLTDRSQDTDYRLETVAGKLLDAEGFERKGNRGLAVAVVEAAQQMLPKDYVREHDYLEIVKATIWSREGEGRDAVKATELMEPVAQAARQRGDQRLLADLELAYVVLLLAQGDRVGAVNSGYFALTGYTLAQAHTRGVEAARQLAFQFLWADAAATARTFARRAYTDALQIDDDELLIQTCLDAGRIELATGDDPDPKFLQAYEAAYRINSLGWRSVVIALAVDAWHSHGDMQSCIRWGDRLREREVGGLPGLAETGLYAADYITLLAQYFFAREEVAKGSDRGQEAAKLALKTIESLPEYEQAEWTELADKLRGGLLKPDEDK